MFLTMPSENLFFDFKSKWPIFTSQGHTLGRDVPVLVLVLSSLSVLSSLRNEVRDDRDAVIEQNKKFDEKLSYQLHVELF